MKFPKPTKKALTTGLIGLAALGSAAVIAPSIASAQVIDDAPATVSPRAEAFQSLIDDGTITEAQAAEIQARVEAVRGERIGGHGHGRFGSEVLTDLLGLTAEEISEAVRGGQTLAEVAEANGVSTQTLIDTLVAEANTRLDARVADGTVSAEDADARRADIVEKITARVNGERPEGFEGRGHRHGPRSFLGAPDADAADAAAGGA